MFPLEITAPYRVLIPSFVALPINARMHSIFPRSTKAPKRPFSAPTARSLSLSLSPSLFFALPLIPACHSVGEARLTLGPNTT